MGRLVSTLHQTTNTAEEEHEDKQKSSQRCQQDDVERNDKRLILTTVPDERIPATAGKKQKMSFGKTDDLGKQKIQN